MGLMGSVLGDELLISPPNIVNRRRWRKLFMISRWVHVEEFSSRYVYREWIQHPYHQRWFEACVSAGQCCQHSCQLCTSIESGTECSHAPPDLADSGTSECFRGCGRGIRGLLATCHPILTSFATLSSPRLWQYPHLLCHSITTSFVTLSSPPLPLYPHLICHPITISFVTLSSPPVSLAR